MINVALRKRSLIQGPIDDTTTIALETSILGNVDGGCGRTAVGRGGCCSCCSGVARAGGADAAELRLAAGGDGFVGEAGGLRVDGCGVSGAEGGVGGVDWASGCAEEGAVTAGGEICQYMSFGRCVEGKQQTCQRCISLSPIQAPRRCTEAPQGSTS